MFNAFAVALREMTELLLIAEAMHLCLRQRGRADLSAHVVAGMAGGVAAGLALAAWAALRPIDPAAVAAVGIVFALTMLLLASGMLSSAAVIRGRVHGVIDGWVDSAVGPVAVAGFALVAGLRECLELALFFDAMRQGVGQEDAATGVLLGLVAAGCLAVVYRTVRMRLNLLALFRCSTILMALFAIQLLIAQAGDLLRAQLAEGSSWLTATQPFLEGGRWYPWLCAVLMAGPLLALARRWWRGTGTAG